MPYRHKLVQAFRRSKLTQGQAAKTLGIRRETFNRKLRGRSTLTTYEAEHMLIALRNCRKPKSQAKKTA